LNFLNRSAYTAKDSSSLPVNEKVGREAPAIREALGTRIPLTDLLIAACAKANDFSLVYRDKHLADIPENLLGQLRLPAK
jgi:predicted nucleic acid-binding protein